MTTSLNQSPLRAMNYFAGIYSGCISIATKMFNNEDGLPDIEIMMEDFAVEELKKESTQSLFYAASHVLSERNISELNKGDGRATTLQDALIVAFSKVIVNDTLIFTGLSQEYCLTEGDAVEHTFPLTVKVEHRNVPKEVVEISDELRDEMSGAHVTPSAGDSDCGTACTI